MLELLGDLHALNTPSDLDILLKIAHLLSVGQKRMTRASHAELFIDSEFLD